MVRTMAVLPLVAAAVVAVACGSDTSAPTRAGEHTSSTAATTVPAAPTLEEIGNATFTGLADLGGPITLTSGRWEGEPFAPGSASRPTVTLAPGFRLTGDLDGDGIDEAVVVLAHSAGGSGTFTYFAVVAREDANLRTATAPLGDRVQIRSARVQGNVLTASVVRAGANDPMCCPGELADLAWRYSGDALSRESSAGTTGRLSLDTLAGTKWVLRAWGDDDAAPTDPEITLEYDDGRLAGSSGCNRYTTAVNAGDLPGEFSVGPVAGTRMACPEPAASVETRFLRQLDSARRFGFALGRLSITYETSGSVMQAMQFEAR